MSKGAKIGKLVDVDGDAFNAHLQKARRQSSWKRNWEDFQNNRAQFIGAVSALPQDELLWPYSRPASSFPTAYHAAKLRRELGTPMPKALLEFKGHTLD